MKLYFPIKNHEKLGNCTHLKVEFYYHLGGMNYFTYKNEPRGYYISISPIERIDRDGCILESYAAFSGKKYLLKEVKRKSAKAEAEAMAIFKESYMDYIQAWFPHVEVEIN